MTKRAGSIVRRLWGGIDTPDDAPQTARARSALMVVLLAVFALRLGLAWLSPAIHHADEVYQVSEQAHRAVHGYGIESWEFRAGARAGIYPAMVLPIYRLDVPVAVRQFLVAVLFTGLSLIPVAVAFLWASALYGVRGGIVAAVMMGTWFELVYFAPRPTGDALGAYFFFPALFLGRPAARTADLFLAGVCLSLAVLFRMQIAPAVALTAFLLFSLDWRQRLAPLSLGLVTGLAVVGLIEWLWWGVPFKGHWGYLSVEFVHGASTYFTREPLTFFAKNYILIYGGALPLIVALAYGGLVRAPILLVAAIALVLPFHFVAHKEYRFLVPALPVLLMAMGLGAAALVTRVERLARPRNLSLALVAWLTAMAAMSWGDTYRPNWTRQRNHVRAFREIGKQPDVCGLALVGIRWYHTPGYAGLGRDVPMYEAGREGLPQALTAAANYVVLGHKVPPPPAPYERWLEYSRPVEYVYRRPGGCVTTDELRVKPVGIPGT